MDSLDVVALTRRLVDVESTTGQEAVVCAMVGEELEQRGYTVTRQTVTDRRVNLLATVGTPEVIFSTHIMDNAERLCDSVCIIAHGDKVLDGGVAEVKRARGTRSVALALDGEIPGAVHALLNDKQVASRVDDQNRYFEIELAVPLSPGDILKKRKAIFMHQSQKDEALFPGSDPREFWQRAEDRNTNTAAQYNQVGLPEYFAMEAFVRWNGVPI